MSLTTFLKNRDVKEKFAQQFTKPRFSLKKEILAPPITKHYSLVGTAFDYLMRFYLKHLNPDAVTKRWVAELSISHPLSPLLKNVIIDATTHEVTDFTETKDTKQAKYITEKAKIVYSNYLSSGEVTDELIESVLLLAQLDPIFRAGFVDENIGTIDEGDVADLRNLISIVNPEAFRAQELCMLNPTFGEGSRLVGGADADLLIDDALIDIKTTKSLKLNRDYFNQIIGYYILFKIGGVDHALYVPKVERIGIYYSRYGELYTIPIRTVLNEERLPPFIEWFRKRAAGG
jgi:hypothetical protein